MHLVSSGLRREIRAYVEIRPAPCFHRQSVLPFIRLSAPETAAASILRFEEIGYFHNNEIYLFLKTTSHSHAIRSVSKVGRPGRRLADKKTTWRRGRRRRANTYIPRQASQKQTCIKAQTESKRTRNALCVGGDKSRRHTGAINGPLIISIRCAPSKNC